MSLVKRSVTIIIKTHTNNVLPILSWAENIDWSLLSKATVIYLLMSSEEVYTSMLVSRISFKFLILSAKGGKFLGN